MNCAILGCGYVADFYMATLSSHPELAVSGCYDLNPQRLAEFSKFYKVTAYPSLESLLADDSVEMVLNLTNPRSHYETTKVCLEAGKHVYSEKPLAMDTASAAELAGLAKSRGLGLATAPCSLLSETAQTLWKGVKEGVTGPVKLVYAAFDDGMIHRHHFKKWKSATGAYWPAKDEFEVGCTYEHAAYVLSWLAAIFGPARRIHAYSTTCVTNKGIAVDTMAPDFTVGCIEYDNNVVARVTCSILAPLDKSIQIIGEEGMLYTKFVRNDGSPVYFQSTTPNRILSGIASRLGHWRVRFEQLLRLPFSLSGMKFERKFPYARRPKFQYSAGNKPVDFLRGPAELVRSIAEARPCRLSPELGVHLTEVIESLQHPERFDNPHTLTTTFPAIEPLPWE
ncbi:MAG: Gfo/Idh/MocA family oxidoreductase [Planctomycetaceae bacterium]